MTNIPDGNTDKHQQVLPLSIQERDWTVPGSVDTA